MMTRQASENQPALLAEGLRHLSRGLGVQRDDLTSVLHGELNMVARRWGIRTDSDIKYVRSIVTENLIAYIENWQPTERNRVYAQPELVARNKVIALVGFNVTDWTELHKLDLMRRWRWLENDYKEEHLRVFAETSRRIFRQAVGQISERLAKDLQGLMMSTEVRKSPISGPESTDLIPNIAVQDRLLVPLIPNGQSSLADLLPLSGQVRQALEIARNTCQQSNRRYYTSDTLLALLDQGDGHVRECFDCVSEGLADRVRHKLQQVQGLGDRAFVPFEWTERDELRLAWRYASSDGAVTISDLHVLLAVLDSRTSETRQSLQRFLQEDYAKVRAAAERGRRDGPEKIKTPIW